MPIRRALIFAAALSLSAPLAGCGAGGARTDESTRRPSGSRVTRESAERRSQAPGCRRLRRASSYASVGLRGITPFGEEARQFRRFIKPLLPSDATYAQADRAGYAVLSLGDGDGTGELGEELEPQDREDVGVVFRPLPPTSSRNEERRVLSRNVRQVTNALRSQGTSVRISTGIRGRIARITATYEVGPRDPRVRTAVALTACALVQATGWPTHVERVLDVVTDAAP